MGVFKKYSEYYDLLYKDKDYLGEADYIDSLLKEYAPEANSVLNLGCGTGRHDKILADRGYEIHGVDFSEEMLTEARKNETDKLKFYQGDITKFRLNKKFDAVLALFHVMSYQTNNDDILNVLKNTADHLESGGIFIFDCWYGPAVLTDRPAVRMKVVENDEVKVTRVAVPKIYPNENLVDVNYSLFVQDKKDDKIYTFEECHHMRYLFYPELSLLLQSQGFKIIRSEEWLTKKELDFNSWGACFVCMKI